MLRLRAYEKLQHLVQDGRVTKIGKEYRGIPAALNELIEGMAELARQTSVRSAAVAVPVPAVRARAKAAK